MSIEAPIQGIPKGRFWFTCEINSTSNSVLYIGLGGTATSSATEANTDQTINFPFIVRRVQANVTTNSKSASTTLAFRDDGASIGALTVNAGATGESDSGALSTVVASGSKCNFLRDTSASASGTLVCTINVECEPLV